MTVTRGERSRVYGPVACTDIITRLHGRWQTRLYQGVVGLNHEDEIISLKGEVARLSADISNLNRWQKTQNGALLRVDDRVNNIYKIMLGTAGTAVLSFLGTIITLLAILARGQ